MNYVLNEKINLSHESIYNINTFRIYMIKILLIWYIIMYFVYSYVHSLPLIITLNICEILRNNWIHLLKKNTMLPGFIKIYHRFAFFNELMHRIEKKKFLNLHKYCCCLEPIQWSLKKSQISWSLENHKWFTPIFQWKFLEHLAFFKLDTVYHCPDIKLLITSLLLNALIKNL